MQAATSKLWTVVVADRNHDNDITLHRLSRRVGRLNKSYIAELRQKIFHPKMIGRRRLPMSVHSPKFNEAIFGKFTRETVQEKRRTQQKSIISFGALCSVWIGLNTKQYVPNAASPFNIV